MAEAMDRSISEASSLFKIGGCNCHKKVCAHKTGKGLCPCKAAGVPCTDNCSCEKTSCKNKVRESYLSHY